MKQKHCQKCNNSQIQHNGELCNECWIRLRSGNELYAGEAITQDPYIKTLISNASKELKNGNLQNAKHIGSQAESLQPNCSTILSLMGEICRACGEESLAMDYFTRAMEQPQTAIINTKTIPVDYPRHTWLAVLLLIFVIASAIAMMIAVDSKTTDTNHHISVNVIKTSSVITEPAWEWHGATIYNVELDKTVIPTDEISMKGGSDAYHSGNYQRAVSIYTKLLKSKVVDPNIYQYLAYSYQQMGDSQHALKMLQACVKKCSINGDNDDQSIENTKKIIKKLLESKK